jgi:hypothetical protein
MRDETLHQDLNPYASPECVDPLPTDVFGAWRDGSMLVIHKQTNLPRVCVVTGKPAAGARDQLLVWKSPGEFLSRQTHLMVPLCRKELERYKLARRLILSGWLLTGGAVALGVLRLILLTNDPLTRQILTSLAVLTGGAGLVAWLVGVAINQIPLSVAMGRGDHIWLAGAHREFLNRLPQWAYNDETQLPR